MIQTITGTIDTSPSAVTLYNYLKVPSSVRRRVVIECLSRHCVCRILAGSSSHFQPPEFNNEFDLLARYRHPTRWNRFPHLPATGMNWTEFVTIPMAFYLSLSLSLSSRLVCFHLTLRLDLIGRTRTLGSLKPLENTQEID